MYRSIRIDAEVIILDLIPEHSVYGTHLIQAALKRLFVRPDFNDAAFWHGYLLP
jgi:hypothetical protein